MVLLVVGLSHRTASLALREKASLVGNAERTVLERLLLDPNVEEAVALSTCNRTELYAAVRFPEEGAETLCRALVEATRVSRGELERSRYTLTGPRAVLHLLRVAASLDSMVLGETEIQGQVREAFGRAEQEGTAGPVLHDLFRRALVSGKRVRRRTAVGRGSLSVSQAAVEAALGVMPDVGSRRTLLLGAGRAGEATARALVGRGLDEIVVLNRSLPTARRLAARFGGRAATLDALGRELAAADIVVCSTGSPVPMISAAAVERALDARRDRPIVIIDIAVPRDVAPSVRLVEGAVLFDIDDLDRVVQHNHHGRVREAERAEGIVRDEAARYHARRGPGPGMAGGVPSPAPCAA